MRSRLSFIVLVAIMAGIGLAIALTSHRVDTLGIQLQDSQADRTSLRADLAKQEKASTALADQVKRLGGKPVVDPPATNIPGPPGPAPTESQVSAAVADYCIGDRCKPTVSRAQVAEAVSDYCAGGTCKGTPGKDGTSTDGTDGTDGKNGAPGPGPTPEQIAAAVEAYCADGNCRGPAGQDGANGTNGANGKDGRSVQSVQCDNGVGTFTFTYSDGTTQTVQCSPAGTR